VFEGIWVVAAQPNSETILLDFLNVAEFCKYVALDHLNPPSFVCTAASLTQSLDQSCLRLKNLLEHLRILPLYFSI